jgi:hypothetical protein
MAAWEICWSGFKGGIGHFKGGIGHLSLRLDVSNQRDGKSLLGRGNRPYRSGLSSREAFWSDVQSWGTCRLA